MGADTSTRGTDHDIVISKLSPTRPIHYAGEILFSLLIVSFQIVISYECTLS